MNFPSSYLKSIDVVGRYSVDINGKSYDTILVLDIESHRDCRTVLWRRFNHDDWKLSHFKQKWTEKLPNNERVNLGSLYLCLFIKLLINKFYII